MNSLTRTVILCSTLDRPRVSGKRALTESTESSGNQAVTAAVDRALHANDSRTRRWGKGRKRADGHTVTNKFARVGPVWFYSLVGSFMQQKDDITLWGGATGSALLARFFVTLAAIVECCGKGPGSELLAKDMLDLVWNFRTAEVPEVRLSVLCALATSIDMIRVDILLGYIVSGPFESLPQSLQEMAASDPEDSCRSLALFVSSKLTTTVEAVEPLRSLASDSLPLG